VLKAHAPDAPIEVHHGSLSREAREETEAKLRSGEAGLVVSTSSLELGMDIGAVDLVLQWGSPRQAVKLAQRIGRSRHQVGAVAKGLVLTNRLDEELEGLALIDRVRAHSLEPSAPHRGALDVLAHQLVGLTMETGVLRVDEAVAILARTFPFATLTAADVTAVLELLERQGIVRYDGEIVRRRGPPTYQYYYENISTIPDIQQFEVKDVTTKRTIGRLDQVFVGEHGEPGKPFILKGSSWRIVSVDEEKKLVFVEPMYRDLSTVPYWVGELIPVDYATAQAVGRLRRRVLHDAAFPASEAQRTRLRDTRAQLGALPDDRHIIAEQKLGTSTVVVHTCWGTKLNQTFATLLSTLLSSKTGFLVEARSDPYRILLTSSGALDAQLVMNTWMALPANLEDILSAAVVGTHPLNWKTWYVARRFGVIARSAQYDRRAARLIQERFRGTALYREILRELFHEKYDLPRARAMLERLRRGDIKLEARKVPDFSPLAKPILEHASGFVALPASIEKAIIDLVKERLTNARHRLLCLSCGQWEVLLRTHQITAPLACPRCHSRLITETYPSDSELPGIVQKRRRHRPLTKAEEERFRRAWKTSSLIQTFGLKAITVLGAFGVGPDTAARILRRPTEDDELYRNIYRAEKTFVMTRAFWD
jgi:ATP-dependent Lhr-like helicase